MEQNKYMTAYYEDDDLLLKGIKELKEKGVKIKDVITPFPVHGLDKLLGYRRSWISRVGFIGGMVGGISAFLFQTWVFTKAYPLNIGGKPFFSVPTFIPITFEMTVLFAAFSMVFAFLIRSKLGPGAENFIHDEKTTDDRFLLVVDLTGTDDDSKINEISQQLTDAGAMGINIKN